MPDMNHVDPLPPLSQLSLMVKTNHQLQSQQWQQVGSSRSHCWQQQQQRPQSRQQLRGQHATALAAPAEASRQGATLSVSRPSSSIVAGPSNGLSSSNRNSSGAGPNAGNKISNEHLPDCPEGPGIIKVSAKSAVSAVAGKIAHNVREENLPRIMVAGNSSIGTATKAILQARGFLRLEGRDVAFYPVFRSGDRSRALLELVIVHMPVDRGSAVDNLAQTDNAGGHETRISSTSRHARAANIVARQLCARGISMLCSVGQEALANSVMAAAHAGCLLADSGRQMVVQPSQLVLSRGEEQLHSIKLAVMFA